MNSVFISGSREINFLPNQAIVVLENYLSNGVKIYVGDAGGVDTILQLFCYKKNYNDLIITFIGSAPRNNKHPNCFLMSVETYDKKGREAQGMKDSYMTNATDESFVIWDGASKGSYENILRSMEQNKLVQVFYNDQLISYEKITKELVQAIYYENHYFSISEYLQSFPVPVIKSVSQAKSILDKESSNTEISEFTKNKIIRGRSIRYYKKSILDKYLPKEDKAYRLF